MMNPEGERGVVKQLLPGRLQEMLEELVDLLV
jgi:hypothetical protein